MIRLKMFYRFACTTMIAVTILSCSKQVETYNGPERNKDLYGPQAQVYELPVVQGKVYYVAPNGNPDAEGLKLEEPTTIESAISRVSTGDAIVMRGGIYRTGNLTFNQGITIQPYRDEQPVLNGTLVAENWEKSTDGLWVTQWDYLFPAGPESWWRRDREEKFTPLHRFNNDGIFIDGKFLESAGSIDEVNEGSCYIDYQSGKIYIGADPSGKLIEITAFRKAIVRTTEDVHGKTSDGKGPVINGLTITQYPDTMVHIDGYYPQGISSESEHGKDVVGTVFENCTFSKCFRIGVFAIGDSMVMRHCKIVDSNTEGLYIVASSDVLLEWNVFANNNIERWTGFFPAAVKIFNQTHRVTCRNNLIIDHPHSNGLWYDVGNLDGVFVNNWIERVGDLERYRSDQRLWASYSGFFYEISSKAICAGNVFVDNAQGILVLNAADVEIYNNTLINSTVSFGRNNRGDENDHFGWHILTGPGVDERDGHVFKNNLMYMTEDFFRPAISAWQPSEMCQRLNKPQLKDMNNNLFIMESDKQDAVLITWSPANNEACLAELKSPEEINALFPEFSDECNFLKGYSTKLFADFQNFDFSLKGDSATLGKGAIVPEHIANALALKNNTQPFLGAYPSK